MSTNDFIVDAAISNASTNPVQNKIVNARFKAADDVVAALSNSLQSAYNHISTLEDLLEPATFSFTFTFNSSASSVICKKQGNICTMVVSLQIKVAVASGSTIQIGSIPAGQSMHQKELLTRR